MNNSQFERPGEAGERKEKGGLFRGQQVEGLASYRERGHINHSNGERRLRFGVLGMAYWLELSGLDES